MRSRGKPALPYHLPSIGSGASGACAEARARANARTQTSDRDRAAATEPRRFRDIARAPWGRALGGTRLQRDATARAPRARAGAARRRKSCVTGGRVTGGGLEGRVSARDPCLDGREVALDRGPQLALGQGQGARLEPLGLVVLAVPRTQACEQPQRAGILELRELGRTLGRPQGE